MSRVDFYVLSDSGDLARNKFVCRLAEKAYRLNNTVHICTDGPQSTQQIDDLLWTYRDGSFVPHEIAGAGPEPESPVTIGPVEGMTRRSDLLINLADSIPADCSSFARVAEIVTSDEDSRRQSRLRFTRYREMGHILETHKL